MKRFQKSISSIEKSTEHKSHPSLGKKPKDTYVQGPVRIFDKNQKRRFKRRSVLPFLELHTIWWSALHFLSPNFFPVCRQNRPVRLSLSNRKQSKKGIYIISQKDMRSCDEKNKDFKERLACLQRICSWLASCPHQHSGIYRWKTCS